MDISLIVNISSRAWAIPILAKLYSGVSGRQASLLAATGASRTAFRQSLEHLINLGLLERNPGHGHPLRPEFRLTPKGQAVAKIANTILEALNEQEQHLLRRSWTLPVLTTLRSPKQFIGIKHELVSITDRALSQSLRQMEERGWVFRHIDDQARPPRPIYNAINQGAVINAITTPITLT